MSNTGVISGTHSVIKHSRYARYLEQKTALVAQGGGQRGIFTAGVLDAFLLSDFDPFDSFYGTSAGALNLSPYLCQQPGLAKAFIMDLTTTPEFFHLFSYIRRKQQMNLDWALEQIKHYPYKLDLDMGKRTLKRREAYAAVTNTATLRDEYLPIIHHQWFDILRATCAIPGLYYHPVKIGDTEYVDGGVSAAIPVQEAWRQGARNLVVIMTEIPGRKENKVAEVLSEVVTQTDSDWFKRPISAIQHHWEQTVESWKVDWNHFREGQVGSIHTGKSPQSNDDTKKRLNTINGGRWLFGAGDVYRLSHLLGNEFDSGLADLLMMHYQTYSLTERFMAHPPEDSFIVTICPSQPLRSSSLMSKKEDLQFDYELGLEAGYHYIREYMHIYSQYFAASER
ncbi:patatin-like phospholipase family protein [Vibrio albus]|nr:patatin-like phospholipase family protein [Vibrio albus]